MYGLYSHKKHGDTQDDDAERCMPPDRSGDLDGSKPHRSRGFHKAGDGKQSDDRDLKYTPDSEGAGYKDLKYAPDSNVRKPARSSGFRDADDAVHSEAETWKTYLICKDGEIKVGVQTLYMEKKMAKRRHSKGLDSMRPPSVWWRTPHYLLHPPLQEVINTMKSLLLRVQ